MKHSVRTLIACVLLFAPEPVLAQTDAQTPAGTAAPSLTAVPPGALTPVVGRYVRDMEGNDVGRVWDVLVDNQGIPRAAVIDYGGVLGIGKRKVAVAWKDLKFGMTTSSDDVTLSLSREQMGAIPDYVYGATGDTAVGGRQAVR